MRTTPPGWKVLAILVLSFLVMCGLISWLVIGGSETARAAASGSYMLNWLLFAFKVTQWADGK